MQPLLPFPAITVAPAGRRTWQSRAQVLGPASSTSCCTSSNGFQKLLAASIQAVVQQLTSADGDALPHHCVLSDVLEPSKNDDADIVALVQNRPRSRTKTVGTDPPSDDPAEASHADSWQQPVASDASSPASFQHSQSPQSASPMHVQPWAEGGDVKSPAPVAASQESPSPEHLSRPGPADGAAQPADDMSEGPDDESDVLLASLDYQKDAVMETVEESAQEGTGNWEGAAEPQPVAKEPWFQAAPASTLYSGDSSQQDHPHGSPAVPAAAQPRPAKAAGKKAPPAKAAVKSPSRPASADGGRASGRWARASTKRLAPQTEAAAAKSPSPPLTAAAAAAPKPRVGAPAASAPRKDGVPRASSKVEAIATRVSAARSPSPKNQVVPPIQLAAIRPAARPLSPGAGSRLFAHTASSAVKRIDGMAEAGSASQASSTVSPLWGRRAVFAAGHPTRPVSAQGSKDLKPPPMQPHPAVLAMLAKSQGGSKQHSTSMSGASAGSVSPQAEADAGAPHSASPAAIFNKIQAPAQSKVQPKSPPKGARSPSPPKKHSRIAEFFRWVCLQRPLPRVDVCDMSEIVQIECRKAIPNTLRQHTISAVSSAHAGCCCCHKNSRSYETTTVPLSHILRLSHSPPCHVSACCIVVPPKESRSHCRSFFPQPRQAQSSLFKEFCLFAFLAATCWSPTRLIPSTTPALRHPPGGRTKHPPAHHLVSTLLLLHGHLRLPSRKSVPQPHQPLLWPVPRRPQHCRRRHPLPANRSPNRRQPPLCPRRAACLRRRPHSGSHLHSLLTPRGPSRGRHSLLPAPGRGRWRRMIMYPSPWLAGHGWCRHRTDTRP